MKQKVKLNFLKTCKNYSRTAKWFEDYVECFDPVHSKMMINTERKIQGTDNYNRQQRKPVRDTRVNRRRQRKPDRDSRVDRQRKSVKDTRVNRQRKPVKDTRVDRQRKPVKDPC